MVITSVVSGGCLNSGRVCDLAVIQDDRAPIRTHRSAGLRGCGELRSVKRQELKKDAAVACEAIPGGSSNGSGLNPERLRCHQKHETPATDGEGSRNMVTP